MSASAIELLEAGYEASVTAEFDQYVLNRIADLSGISDGTGTTAEEKFVHGMALLNDSLERVKQLLASGNAKTEFRSTKDSRLLVASTKLNRWRFNLLHHQTQPTIEE